MPGSEQGTVQLCFFLFLRFSLFFCDAEPQATKQTRVQRMQVEGVYRVAGTSSSSIFCSIIITGIAVSKHMLPRDRTLSAKMESDLRAAEQKRKKKRGGASAGTYAIPTLSVVLALATGSLTSRASYSMHDSCSLFQLQRHA